MDLYEIKGTSSNFVIILHISGSITKPEDFKQFVLRLESESFGCQLCSYQQKQFGIVNNHVESKHFPNTFNYSCSYCNKIFGTNKAFVCHKNTTSISPKFKNCLGTIHSPEDFEQYIIRNNGQGRIGCQLCQHTVLNFTDMRNHVESIHFPNTFSYKCPFCDQAFGTNKAFKVHKQRSHK